MPRTTSPEVAAAILDPANASTPTAELSRQTGIPEATLRAARAREGLASPAARGGQRRWTITLHVTEDQYQSAADYADRLGVDIEDGIKDNVLGQCDRCSEPAILDARKVALCERCRPAGREEVRTGGDPTQAGSRSTTARD
jgi:hypothetical protein